MFLSLTLSFFLIFLFSFVLFFLHLWQAWLLFSKWRTDFLLLGVLLLGIARDFRRMLSIESDF